MLAVVPLRGVTTWAFSRCEGDADQARLLVSGLPSPSPLLLRAVLARWIAAGGSTTEEIVEGGGH